jgi:adenylate cyclase
MAADVVGYTRLMDDDQVGTVDALRHLRKELLEPLVRVSAGVVIKRMGDGWIVEFPSVSDAVDCAIRIQEGLKGHDTICLRIGIHIGEVVAEDEDLFGDGVNVAARLEALAEPGSILISDTAYHSLDNRTAGLFAGGEAQQLKNVARTVAIWHWPVEASSKAQTKLDLSDKPDKPSIAVLPFTNMSIDPEQEFFADGIVEDLITALSRFRWLHVVARNSCFSFKGKAAQIAEVSEALGVRYVVEGSIRSSTSRLRVTVQLIDAANDDHIWAENYDRQPGDLFDLQDEITQSIVGVLVPALSTAERERSMRSNRPDLDAWEIYQRGLAHYYRPFSVEDNLEARRLFALAIEKDPNFADPNAMLAMNGIYAVNSGQSSYTETREQILAEAEKLAQRAVRLDEGNALGHIAWGRVNGLQGRNDIAVAACKTAIRLNPNLAMAYHELGMALSFTTNPEAAIEFLDEAIRLSPNDPARWNFYLVKSRVLFSVGRYQEALPFGLEACRLRPEAFFPLALVTSIQVELDMMSDAESSVQRILGLRPEMNCRELLDIYKRVNLPGFEGIVESCRKAGMPE